MNLMTNITGFGSGAVNATRRLRLLCATDLSGRSDQAVRRALLLAGQLDAELLLFHSIDAAPGERVARRKQVRAQLALDTRVRKLFSTEREVKVSVRVGHYRDTIAAMAQEWGADLIILGSHRTRLGDGVIGTTAERVIRRARRPVLVVKRDVTGPYEQVLLTSDLSSVSAGAASLTQDLGLLEGSETTVVHALTPAAGSMLRFSGVSEPEMEKYVRQLRHLTAAEVRQQFEQAGLSRRLLSVVAEQSSPLKAIEQTAQRMDADLVVVAAGRFPTLKRILLGSISNEVLRRLTCDVLLVSFGTLQQMRQPAIKHAA